MNTIVQNIINTAPVSIDDNYKIRLHKRADQLLKRLEIIRAYSNPGFVEYENGMAVRFFPNVYLTEETAKRCGRLRGEIRKELNEIQKLKP